MILAHESCHNPNTADEHCQPLSAEAGSDFFIHDRREKALYLCSNIFNTKVRIGDSVFTSPTGDGSGNVFSTKVRIGDNVFTSPTGDGSGNVFSTKVRIGDSVFTSPTGDGSGNVFSTKVRIALATVSLRLRLETGQLFYLVIDRTTRTELCRLQDKDSTFISRCFRSSLGGWDERLLCWVICTC